MEHFPILAERTLLLVEGKSKQSVRLRVVIGKPYWIEEGISAACPIAIHGLVGRVQDVHGVDLFQALELAIGLANSLLSSIPPEKVLVWPDGEPYP
jgi:hypothetical protein